jgi:hypothetical protein
VETHAAVRAWVEAWQEGWPAKDVERIVSRYRPDAPYRSHPFREVSNARAYVTQAFAEEDLVRCWFGDPVVDHDRATVEYWAILRRPAGQHVTIAGTAMLRFDRDGLVSNHRDYWDQQDGTVDPPAGWGSA